eukprot:COSAG02_NODE_56432_length_285_cov_1.311828_1_plen_72_part_01
MEVDTTQPLKGRHNTADEDLWTQHNLVMHPPRALSCSLLSDATLVATQVFQLIRDTNAPRHEMVDNYFNGTF